MQINLFDTVRAFLDKRAFEVTKSRGLTQRDLYRQMGHSLEVMLNEWRREAAPSIPYQDAVCQLAYVYSHVAMNAQLLYEALCFNFEFSNVRVSLGGALLDVLKGIDRLRICAFGSGPGTELLGLSKFLGPQCLPRCPVELDVLRIDRVEEWAQSCEALEESIYSQFGHRRKLTFRTSFLPWNSSAPDFALLTKAMEGRHLFLFSYVVSELLEEGELDAVADLLSHMARASPGAAFLILDRCGNRTQANISTLLAKAGLHSRAEDTLSNSVDYWEHPKRSLQPYIDAIGHMPRGSRQGGKREAYFVIAKGP